MIVQNENQSKLKRFFREYRPEIKFVSIFCVGIVLAFLLVHTKVVSINVIKPITIAETFVASQVLNHVLNFPNTQKGTHLYGLADGEKPNRFGMEVKNNCNGIYESIVFLMAFIAIQIPWRRKIGWMTFGFFLFHVINEMRLISLFIIGSNYSALTFKFFHETFWNYALVIFTLGIFIFCAHQVSKSPKRSKITEEAPAK